MNVPDDELVFCRLHDVMMDTGVLMPFVRSIPSMFNAQLKDAESC